MKPKDAYKYHLKQSYWSVMVRDKKIGETAERGRGWVCGIHNDHRSKDEAADCIYERYESKDLVPKGLEVLLRSLDWRRRHPSSRTH